MEVSNHFKIFVLDLGIDFLSDSNIQYSIYFIDISLSNISVFHTTQLIYTSNLILVDALFDDLWYDQFIPVHLRIPVSPYIFPGSLIPVSRLFIPVCQSQ